jgi:serine/threonine protein kinase
MTPSPPRRRQTSRHYEPGAIVAEKYELRSPLGEGGMGSVWLANNRVLEYPVALKLLHADFDAEDAGDRLLREARAAARIGHRAIVRVFDFGYTEQGDPFIVMELLEGETLAEILLKRGQLDAIEAVQILLPVVDAVAEAHACGIVHRDLKPANIFLVREQRRIQPKVVDFGIAKMDHGSPESSRVLTRQGEVIGSPGYMSPEQARGSSVISGRTDVWAICVVLYECITGATPFGGDNYNAWMRAIIEDAVVPSVDLNGGDAELWAILERGMRKTPEERWGSMRELGAALAGWLILQGVEQDVCGDPLAPFLSTDPPAPLDTSSRRSNVSVSVRKSDPHAPTMAAPRGTSSSHDEVSGTGSAPSFRLASAVTRIKSPEAVSKTSIVLATFAGLAILATFVGTIVALDGRSPVHEAAALAVEPAAPPGTMASPPVLPTTGTPVAPVLAEALPAPSSSTVPTSKDAPARRATKASSTPARPRAKAAPPAPVVPPTSNSDLKDPY